MSYCPLSEAADASDVNVEQVEPRRIQGYDVTLLRAVYHAIEHLADHTGRIV